jgi:hypothetical protein
VLTKEHMSMFVVEFIVIEIKGQSSDLSIVSKVTLKMFLLSDKKLGSTL